ncbi:MAG: 2-hydroxychromene-2-carboxylate isomerase [Betaproteobacteria bacterium]|nr:2-hydroxychromene-2-carboxylate isomerase [Betaproteobacteria bacterium]
MAAPIEFYFDFSSPYGYIAAERIGAIAAKHGREMVWRPVLLGVVFKTTGGQPLPGIPLKGEYALRDIPRSARYHGLPYRQPTAFLVSTLSPVRAFYWLDGRDQEKARLLALAIYRAYFTANIDISSPDTIAGIATTLGIAAADTLAGINDPATKERTRDQVEKAMARGVFGSPIIIIDGEPFWGADRLDQVERWLATGGW